MRFLLVDDEPLTLMELKNVMQRLYPDAEICTAGDYRQALVDMDQQFTAIFMDIEMPGMNGLDLAKVLLARNAMQNIIFVTAYDEYARQAHQLYASGYLTKPVDREDILDAMAHLRYPIPEPEDRKEEKTEPVSAENADRLQIRCFGYFEVFYRGEPLHWDRKVCKEILAYLIHRRGASASRMDICTILWEDSVEIDRKRGYFRALMASLKSTLRQYGAEDVLITYRDSYAVNMKLVDCDFFRWLEGDRDPTVRYHGEYMSQYSWADEMSEQLFRH